jgi:hypothetical protein
VIDFVQKMVGGMLEKVKVTSGEFNIIYHAEVPD